MISPLSFSRRDRIGRVLRISTVLPIASLLVLVSATGLAQQTVRDAAAAATTGTAMLAGVVLTDDADGRPVRRALVNVNNSEVHGASRAALTDDAGRFVVTGLPGGRYTVIVSKPGWVPAYFGSRRAGRGPGIPIALGDGQNKIDLSMKLLRGAAITGRIVDRQGVPQPAVRMMALEYRNAGGQRTLSQMITGISMLGLQTDDRGEYRIYGLPPGEYVVGASPLGVSPTTGIRTMTPEEVRWAMQQQRTGAGPLTTPPPAGPSVTFAPVYYPGTSDAADAAKITLGAGEERTGVDFSIVAVAVSKVQGRIRRSDGLPVRTPQIVLTQPDSMLGVVSMGPMINRASIDPSGAFTFGAVRPGRYLLTARAPSAPPAAPERPAPGAAPVRRAGPVFDLWASMEITVQGADIADLTLMLEPGMTVAGKIVFDATTLAPPDVSRLRLQMGPPNMRTAGSLAGTNMYLGSATPDATFSIQGVSPGSYMLGAFLPQASSAGPDWFVKSIVTKGQDVLDRPFEIRAGEDVSDVVVTVSDRATELSGMLQDALGRPAPEYSVFVIPVDRQYWSMLSTRMRPPVRPSSDGRYRIRGLPPGEYFVAGLAGVEEADYLDAAFLEQVAAAAFKLTLAEGEKKQQDLRLQGSDPRPAAAAAAGYRPATTPGRR